MKIHKLKAYDDPILDRQIEEICRLLSNVDTTSDADKPVSDAVAEALAASVVGANTAITPATKTKITYDAKGLVTAGADATTADIADSSNKRYVTDAQLTVIGNTSGTNSVDQDLSSREPVLIIVSRDATGGMETVNLAGVTTMVVKLDTSANTVKIMPDGANTIQGLTEYELETQYQSATFRLVGSVYIIQ